MSFGIIMYIIGAVIAGIVLTVFYYRWRDKTLSISSRKEAERILDSAQKESERLKKEAKVQVKEQMIQAKFEFDKESKEKRKDLQQLENRLITKEENIEKKNSLLDEKEAELKKRESSIGALENKVKEEIHQYQVKVKEAQERLEHITGLSSEEAKRMQIELILNEAKHEASKRLKQIEDNLKEEAEKKSKEILSGAIQRYAGEFVADRTVSSVNLPNDEMKGRIIGREGRNIRAIEAATGVDLIIDDTPETVVISSFDPIRREVARLSLERLISDGRIHPARIEEIVERSRIEVAKEVKEAGDRAVFEAGIHDVHPEIIKLIGTLKYRTSYSQNQYLHSIEVCFLAGMMAAELGLDQKLAKRAGLLHDIGKAVDHAIEGSHAIIGADLAKKYNENAEVVHAIRAHHDEEKITSPYPILVQAADALSSARPGARREMLESYVKRLEDLEKVTNSFDGVDRSFAIQAGREVRVIVKSEKITDEGAVVLSRDIVKKIETDLSYPGQIRVTVIRETRAVGVAK